MTGGAALRIGAVSAQQTQVGTGSQTQNPQQHHVGVDCGEYQSGLVERIDNIRRYLIKIETGRKHGVHNPQERNVYTSLPPARGHSGRTLGDADVLDVQTCSCDADHCWA